MHHLPLMNGSNEVFIDSEEKANALNEQFTTVFIQDDNNKPSFSSSETTAPLMECPIITPSMVTDSIRNLKASVSRTPDDVPALFLKKTSHFTVFSS